MVCSALQAELMLPWWAQINYALNKIMAVYMEEGRVPGMVPMCRDQAPHVQRPRQPYMGSSTNSQADTQSSWAINR